MAERKAEVMRGREVLILKLDVPGYYEICQS